MNAATKKALAELKKLSAKVGEQLYVMVGHAKACLADADWIASEHGGDMFVAQDWLQAQFFPLIGGFVSLGQLIALHDKHTKEVWQEYRYNLQALLDVDAASREAQGAAKRKSWKAIAQELEVEVEKLKARVAELESEKIQLMKQLVRDAA